MAIELDPKDTAAYRNLGLALHKKGKVDEAIVACRKAIELDPKHASAHDILGSCLIAQGKVDDGIAAYRKAIQIDSKYATAHINLGRALRNQGKSGAAIAAFRQAVEIDSKLAKAHYWLAWELTVCSDLKLREPKQALISARLAVELAPKNGMYWQGLGYAEYRSGNWKGAVQAFQKVKELGSAGDSLEWFPLSMAYWQLGDKDTAHKTYEQAVQWMEKNNPKDGFLRGLQVEAAGLMGIELKKE